MGNKKLKPCPCKRKTDPDRITFRQFKRSKNRELKKYKHLDSSDFVPTAFFVLADA